MPRRYISAWGGSASMGWRWSGQQYKSRLAMMESCNLLSSAMSLTMSAGKSWLLESMPLAAASSLNIFLSSGDSLIGLRRIARSRALVLLILFFCVPPSTAAWDQAMESTFVLASSSGPVYNSQACSKSVRDLMIRQNIPVTAAGLRALEDAELLRIGMLASVACISSWTRDANDTMLQLTDEGQLIDQYLPSTVEVDIMLCIICALLIVIATFHIVPQDLVLAKPAGRPRV